jgi:bacillithiol system protein YtxJ
MKIIFKHSFRCPISAGAKFEVDRFLKNMDPGVEFEIIDVIANKERSLQVAEELDIKHESPQIILLNNENRVKWFASHHRITEKNIREAIEN